MIQTACNQMGYGRDQATFIDLWGDIAASNNNNIPSGASCSASGVDPSQYKNYMYQDKLETGEACGVLGGLYHLQEEAKELDHNLELAFSVGGWTMSGPFSEIAADKNRRTTFIQSIGEVFERFPMFDTVDIDWEYPGGGGLPTNSASDQDGENYALLIGELQDYLDSNEKTKDKKINIAASAVPDKMEKSNIPGLFEAGLDGINVMTYDFFGGNWAPALAHHTNLYKYDSGPGAEQNSVQNAVEYLEENGIDLSKVYIGYGAYSRNALNANITSHSPLQGTFEKIPESQDAIGTFDPLASEYNDVLYNYFDPENQSGKNGYHVYTDAEANADYLYSDTSGVFMSIDTPRSVYAKAKYAEEQGLGGIFTWTIDQDAGLLANAAREGAGYELTDPTNPTIKMADFYFCGENITPDTCEEITGGGEPLPDPGEQPPVADAGPDQTIIATEARPVNLDGTGSYDPNSKPITYNWTQSSGPSVELMEPTTATPSFNAPLPDGQSDSYTFDLVVDNGDKTDSDSVGVVVQNEDTGGGCSDYDYVYPAGMETYDDGTIYPDSEATIVKASDDNLYECIQWAWCRDPNTMDTFAPGVGSDWELAWNLHETCSNNQASNYRKAPSHKKGHRKARRKATRNAGMTPTKITIKVAGPFKVEIE